MTPLQKVERFVDRLYHDRICNQYDAVLPIIADEGDGKSTFISQFGFFWQDVRDERRDPDSLLETMCFTRDGLQKRISSAPKRSLICVPDAARVLHKKEAMQGDQRELEKDFFDVRSSEYVILLGYQDWASVPTFLQERRAKFAFYIPKRGQIRGYNRESLDEKSNNNNDYDWWPESDLVDTFPSLEGTDYWTRYQKLDDEKKNARMGIESENDEDNGEKSKNERIKQISQDIKDEGVHGYVSNHGVTGNPYIDADLIELDYDLSVRDAKKVKKLLERDPDVIISDNQEAIA